MFSCGGGQGVVGEGRPGGLFHGPIQYTQSYTVLHVRRGDDTIGRDSYFVK